MHSVCDAPSSLRLRLRRIHRGNGKASVSKMPRHGQITVHLRGLRSTFADTSALETDGENLQLKLRGFETDSNISLAKVNTAVINLTFPGLLMIDRLLIMFHLLLLLQE